MKRYAPLFTFFFFNALAFSTSLEGVWTSDCQNTGPSNEGYNSQRPVDSFLADGTATLRIHVFEGRNCKGREWDLMTIPCAYAIGKPVANLEDTRELDLVCEFEGKKVTWYEIAEVRESTLRYGDQTGESPDTRPKNLGSVYYRRPKDL